MCGMDRSIACLGTYSTYGGRHGLARRSGTLTDPGSRPRKMDRFANLVARFSSLSHPSFVHRWRRKNYGQRERGRESLTFLFDANNLCLLIFRPSISISRFLLPLRKYRNAIGDGIDFKSCGIFSKMIGSNNDSIC